MSFHRLIATLLVAAGASLAGAQVVPPPEPPPEIRSRRSHELVDLECRTEITRREVTLFANGTVRVKEGELGDRQLLLTDLDPVTLRGYTDRITELDYSEVGGERALPAEGAWVETCRLELDFPHGPRRTFEYSKFDSLSLSLKRAVELTDELAAMATPVQLRQLPLDYEPKAGDILRHRDGDDFEVMGPTSDGKGIELQGVESPLTIYVGPGELRQVFVELKARRSFF